LAKHKPLPQIQPTIKQFNTITIKLSTITMFFSSNKHETKESPASTKKSPPEQNKEPQSPLNRSAKITERLDNAVAKCSPLDEKMKHELRALVTAVKKYQQKTNDMNASKFEVGGTFVLQNISDVQENT
jgi:hypothetical protein